MREFHERDHGDDADNRPDSTTDSAAGHDGDSHRPAVSTVRDAATRIALSLDYQQRVKAAYAVSDTADAASPDDRERGRDMPIHGDHVSSPSVDRVPDERSDDHRRVEARSRETTYQPTRGADLPASARNLPDARDVVPNLEMAEIDERKFSAYSLNPGNPANRGKADGWRDLGYDVDDPQARQKAARELRDLTLNELLANGKVAEVREDSYGSRPRIISGIIGPNGRNATLVTCWLIEDLSGTAVPRLITTWVQPHRDKETGR